MVRRKVFSGKVRNFSKMDKNKCPKIENPKNSLKNEGFLSPTCVVNFFKAIFPKNEGLHYIYVVHPSLSRLLNILNILYKIIFT